MGVDAALVLHAIRTGSGEWLWSGPAWSGVVRGQRENVITALADAIGRGEVYRIDARMGTDPPTDASLYIDRLGHTWHDKTYWPPHEYLAEITGDE